MPMLHCIMRFVLLVSWESQGVGESQAVNGWDETKKGPMNKPANNQKDFE